MCKNLSIKNVKGLNDKLSWDSAIADAEQMIRDRKSEIMGLKASIRVFKQRRDEGVPLPGSQAQPATKSRL